VLYKSNKFSFHRVASNINSRHFIILLIDYYMFYICYWFFQAIKCFTTSFTRS